MPSEETSTVDTKSAVETIQNPVPEHKCCPHCKPLAHAPHTMGCPPEGNGTQQSKEDLDKAVKQAMDDMFSVSSAWQPKQVVKFMIECPSGQHVLVKHMDILDLAAVDLVEDMDIFAKKLFPSKFDDQGNPVDEKESGTIWSALKDPEKRMKLLDMTNRLMAVSAVRPRIIDDGVAVIKDKETGRDETVFGHQMTTEQQLEHFGKPVPKLEPGQAYAGAIGFNDRMAFFTELNKPLGMIEPFRAEQAAMLAGVESSEGIGVPSE